MRLSISNIAWDPAEDEAVLALLQTHAIDAIDVAPGKYFPDPMHVSHSEIARVRRWWNDRGVELVGMQSLLFGTSGLNMFGSSQSQEAMLSRLTAVARIGAGLGATRLVFGSPRNRDRSGLTDHQALETAIRFFRRLGDVAADAGVTICLEPNPIRYGSNFMTSTEETAQVVTTVGHANVRMQLDTGAITVNAEDLDQVIGQYADLIAHVHASEPDLKTLGDGATPHRRVHDALCKHLPDRIVTIEMIASESEPHLNSIARALQIAIAAYQTPGLPRSAPAGAHR
jgi:sugar phosphate isomerase/epimerase